LAWTARQERRVSRRRQNLQALRAAAGAAKTVLVGHSLRQRDGLADPDGSGALRSLVELKDAATSDATDLYFGPAAPAGKEGQWIKTNPGKGWFAYFRLYGPQGPAFDGSWKPGDFEEVSTVGRGERRRVLGYARDEPRS
jgi:hypothetical protein